MKPPTTTKRVRINLVVPIEVKERVVRLMRRTEAANMSEVVRNALIAFEYYLDGGQKPVSVPDREK